MRKRSSKKQAADRGGPGANRSSQPEVATIEEAGAAGVSAEASPASVSGPVPGRAWPSWAVWLVSALLLFHLTALLVCEVAGQVNASKLETDIRNWFWWYLVATHQEFAHSYFAPEPDPATAVVTARLQFASGEPDRTIRLPDPATRPRIRYLRQLALGWHLVHEWNQSAGMPQPYWAASYARHLCRANPGCTRVELNMRLHRIPDLRSVVADVAEGKRPDLDSTDIYTVPELIGVFSCDDL